MRSIITLTKIIIIIINKIQIGVFKFNISPFTRLTFNISLITVPPSWGIEIIPK